MNDALGHDALQNLLESGNRIKELREDIEKFHANAREWEKEMWHSLGRMRIWKERAALAEAELAAALKEKP